MSKDELLLQPHDAQQPDLLETHVIENVQQNVNAAEGEKPDQEEYVDRDVNLNTPPPCEDTFYQSSDSVISPSTSVRGNVILCLHKCRIRLFMTK